MPLFPVDINSFEEVESDSGAPSAQFYIGCPQGQILRIRSICVSFDTDANVAARTLYVSMDTPAAAVNYVFAISPVSQAANTIYHYSIGNVHTRENRTIPIPPATEMVQIPILRPIFVFYPRTLWLTVDNLQAGDRFTNGYALLERFQSA